MRGMHLRAALLFVLGLPTASLAQEPAWAPTFDGDSVRLLVPPGKPRVA